MTNQSPYWMRSLARNAAKSSTATSTAASSATGTPAAATSPTTATSASVSATPTPASSISTATSACSTTSTPCPRSAGWSAETSGVHCSDTLITHFLILERVACLVCYWCYLPNERAISRLTSWSSPHTYIMTVVTKKMTTLV